MGLWHPSSTQSPRCCQHSKHSQLDPVKSIWPNNPKNIQNTHKNLNTQAKEILSGTTPHPPRTTNNHPHTHTQQKRRRASAARLSVISHDGRLITFEIHPDPQRTDVMYDVEQHTHWPAARPAQKRELEPRNSGSQAKPQPGSIRSTAGRQGKGFPPCRRQNDILA